MSRVENPADPERCTWTFPHEQCWNRAQPMTDRCHLHGGLQASRDAATRIYNLMEARSRQRLGELSDQDQVQALREIIALARLAIERRYNVVRTDADFLEACGPINSLQLTLERIVRSAHTIEQNLDTLLSKSSVFRLGELVIGIAADELQGVEEYDEVMGRITNRIVQAVAEAGNGQTPIPKLAEKVREAAIDKRPMFNLKSVKDRIRLAELSKNERLKSLNEDIALAALMIERRWNLIKEDSETDLIQAVPALDKLLRTLERLIKSAHDIEQSLGFLLSEDALRRLGMQISDILTEELQGCENFENLIDSLMNRIANTLSRPRIAQS